jgi:hypothetical protein
VKNRIGVIFRDIRGKAAAGTGLGRGRKSLLIISQRKSRRSCSRRQRARPSIAAIGGISAQRPEEGEQDGTRSAPAGSLAACPRGSETESTDRRRAHHSRRKPAQAGLMPTSAASPDARVINLRAMAMCAMTSSCNVAMEVGSAGAGRVRIQTGDVG